MALEATPITKEVVLFSGNCSPNTKFSASTSPFFLHLSSSAPKRTNSSWSLKCSLNQSIQATYQRPSEIQWSKDLCNTVHLIGYVGCPVEIKHLPSGKVVAWTRLGVKKSSTETTWINLTFWDELANTAYQHVEKGQQIYVCGRLICDTVESDDGKQKTYSKVVVQQLNLVEKSFSEMSLNDGDSIWTSTLFPGKTFSSNGGSNASNTVELWQAFFANPLEWWDNRQTKRNPKSPDFKHKDTGEALWIEGRNNPSWLKSQLAILDSRMGTLQDQNGQMRVRPMSTDELF